MNIEIRITNNVERLHDYVQRNGTPHHDVDDGDLENGPGSVDYIGHRCGPLWAHTDTHVVWRSQRNAVIFYTTQDNLAKLRQELALTT